MQGYSEDKVMPSEKALTTPYWAYITVLRIFQFLIKTGLCQEVILSPFIFCLYALPGVGEWEWFISILMALTSSLGQVCLAPLSPAPTSHLSFWFILPTVLRYVFLDLLKIYSMNPKINSPVSPNQSLLPTPHTLPHSISWSIFLYIITFPKTNKQNPELFSNSQSPLSQALVLLDSASKHLIYSSPSLLLPPCSSSHHLSPGWRPQLLNWLSPCTSCCIWQSRCPKNKLERGTLLH